MTDETTTKRRALLRSVFDGLFALERMTEDADDPQTGIVIETAVEGLRTGYSADVYPYDCEACGKVMLFGEQGHKTEDDCTLCADDAPTWADIKDQWDEDREEHNEGDKARFMANYAAHSAGGGSPDDKVLYEL